MKRAALLTLVTLLALVAVAQPRKKGRTRSSGVNYANAGFLDKQWWIGLTGGMNLAAVPVQARYAGISPVDYDPALTDKKYSAYNLPGTQATLDIAFDYKGVTVSVKPTYRHSRFGYTNGYEWNDSENPDNRLVLHFDEDQQVDYADVPLVVRYSFGAGNLRPFVEGGGYLSVLVTASKTVKVTGTDYASGGVNSFEDPPIIVGATDLFNKHYWGLTGGAGVSYLLGNVRVDFGISFLYGLSNITNGNNRYGNDRLSGIGEAMDDLRMNNLSFSLGCYLPTRFLTKDFKSVNR